MAIQLFKKGSDCKTPFDGFSSAISTFDGYISDKTELILSSGRPTTWRLDDGGNGFTITAEFRPLRMKWENPGPGEDDYPRPAVSNNYKDRIESIDIFTDNTCEESARYPISEEVNPYKLLHDLNFMLSKGPSCDGHFSVSGALTIQSYIDLDGTSCPRQPGLINLQCGGGECCPFLTGEKFGAADSWGDESTWDDTVESNRVAAASYFIKFKMR